MVTYSAISDSSTDYGKNVTGNCHGHDSNEDSDNEESVCSSEDEVLRTVE